MRTAMMARNGVAISANSTAVAPFLVLDKDDEAAAASFSCCDFHLGHRRVSHCVRLAVLDATLMNRSVSACVILPPV